MTSFRQGSIVAVLLLWLSAGGAAVADIRVQVHESVNGAEPVSVVHWFGPARTVRDDGDRFILTRLDQAKTYVVDRAKKQYRVVPITLGDQNEPPAVTMEKTDEVRQVGPWQARRIRLRGPATRNLTIDIWVTDDVDVDVEAFRRLMVRLGSRPGSEWLRAYADIQGFPVLQQVRLERPGIRLHSESRVIAVEQTEPEPGIYSPPKDYKKVR